MTFTAWILKHLDQWCTPEDPGFRIMERAFEHVTGSVLFRPTVADSVVRWEHEHATERDSGNM